MTRRVLSITGTRADYGLMRPVHAMIDRDPDLELHLIVTGMHFLPDFKSSLEEIAGDDFGSHVEIPLADKSSTSSSMAQTMGALLQALAPTFEKIKPDIVLLQGDRGEMLAGAIVAAHMNIAIIHMSGGDRSGTIDDSIRHAITKFAHFHLPTCESSHENLLAMGEEGSRIHIVGEPALDIIKNFKPLSKEALEKRLGVSLADDFILIAQHSVTTEVDQAAEQIAATLSAVKQLGLSAIISAPNSDAGGAAMTAEIQKQLESNPKLNFIPHLGQENFYSLMTYAKAIVGNSSAGILESPSFKIPAINIGTRQHDRLRAGNITDVGYDKAEIESALGKAIASGPMACANPYGDGDTAQKTIAIIKSLRLEPGLLTKWIKGFRPL